jgi:tetratricopeptide (TPR) repeat protein
VSYNEPEVTLKQLRGIRPADVGTLTFILMLTTALASAQDAMKQPHAAALLPGLGQVHHPVTTSSPEAQQFFDQGLALYYGFNMPEAEHSFRRAADLDPNMAMAFWGIALMNGPSYVRPRSPAGEKIAYETIQKAMSLRASCQEEDRAYIEALARRFSDAPQPDYEKLNTDYRDDMQGLMKQYPDDPDAATLYAESQMIIHSWALWEADGTPQEGTLQAVNALENVLRQDPTHIGAMHYYIHAVEGSPHPEMALAVARSLAALAPNAGHLVHMPSHIYLRIGDYAAAARANVEAARADEDYLRANDASNPYVVSSYVHDLEFLAMASAMEGRYAAAREAADQVSSFANAHLRERPQLQHVMIMPMFILLRFHRWADILKVPEPGPDLKHPSMMWHYGRGVALAATHAVREAEHERGILAGIEAATPVTDIFRPPLHDNTVSILHLAETVLDARIAAAKHDQPNATRLFEKAVDLQDNLAFSESLNWYYPVRESLGRVLIEDGQVERAEDVFRADLRRNPGNGRSLFGLLQALKAQKKNADAQWVDRLLHEAWKDADTQLQIDGL